MAKVNSIGLAIDSSDDGKTILLDNSSPTGLIKGLKSNYVATSPPTFEDDSSLGYEVGSRWIESSTNNEYICTDNTPGAAIWKTSTGVGGGNVANNTGSSDNSIARYDGTTGEVIKDSNVSIYDDGSVSLADITQGPTLSERIIDHASIVTSDAGPYDFLLLGMQDNELINIKLSVNGISQDYSKAIAYNSFSAFKKVGPNPPVQLGQDYTVHSEDENLDVRIVISGDDALVQVHGLPSTNINWIASFTIFRTRLSP